MEKNIVVVEDSNFIRSTINAALTKAGFKVFESESAEDLLRAQKFNPSLSTLGMLDKISPDLFIIDIDLKVMSGIELLKMLKSLTSYKNVPVIINSGHTDKDTIIRSITAGAADYVIKEDNYVDILVNKVKKFFEKELSTFETTLEHELEWIKFGNKELSFAMVVITNEEKNDANIGTENFNKIVAKLNEKLRNYDWIFPLDEKTIAVILPLSSVQSIVILRNKVIEEVKLLGEKINVPINIQLGFSHYPTSAKDAKELISVAKGQIK